MSRTILILVVTCLMAGCATIPPAPPPEREPQDLAIVIDRLVPSLLQGQPLKNAELASYLAEYELTRRGIDCRENQITVSYCEGIYTVAFLPEDPGSQVEKYTVEINERDSTILRMTRMRRVAAFTRSGA